jgi:hypothetical protein
MYHFPKIVTQILVCLSHTLHLVAIMNLGDRKLIITLQICKDNQREGRLLFHYFP